jgi:tetratricopeptide (TPR) repeat protein
MTVATDGFQQPETADYQELVDRGHELAWAGQWDEAALLYQNAITLRDDDPVTFIDLGLALYQSRQLKQALRAYQRALELQPGQVAALQKMADIHVELGEKLQAASTYLLLADAYIAARNPAEAVRAWQQVVRYDPLNRVAYRRLAAAYQRGGRNDLAAQLTLALARIHANAGEQDEAIILVEQTLALLPDFAPAHQLLVQLKGSPVVEHEATSAAGRNGASPSATAHAEAVTEGRAPTLDEVPAGAVPEKAGDGPVEVAQQQALRRLAQAFFEQDAADPALEALKARALHFQSRGLVEEAAGALETLVRLTGHNPEIAFLLGTFYQTMFRFNDAVKQFECVVGAPDYALAANYAIGQCYQNQGRPGEALEYFLAALRVTDLETAEQEEADTLIRLYEAVADAYEAVGDYSRAAQVTDEIVGFLTGRGWDEKLRELRARLGVSRVGEFALAELVDLAGSEAILAAMEASRQYKSSGRFGAAIEELYQVLVVAPHYLPLHLLLAELYIADKRPEEAVAKLLTVAEVYEARSKPIQAIQTLRRALALAPTNQNVRSTLIDRLVSHGEIDEALAHLIQLAAGYYHLAQGERALEKLDEALRLAPRGSPEYEWPLKILIRLADIHLQRLDWRRARAAYEGILALRPGEVPVVEQLADLYFKLDMHDRALDLVQRTAADLVETRGLEEANRFLAGQLSLRPQSVELAKLLGEIQSANGDPEGAALAWERAVELLVRRGERMQGAALLRRIIALRTRHERRYRTMLEYLTNAAPS